MTVTRRTLESLCSDLFVAITDTINHALSSAKLPPAAIHEVVLVGGSAKTPKVIDLVTNYFQKTPVEVESSAEMIALGAAMLSIPPTEGSESPSGVLTLEVLESSIG